ncbi:MAG TPA: hypothetical protein HA367_04775 [Candidatus Methanofastidiosum sp.]|nr:hypothetical protein [Methanofastidiosum sp.]
MLPDKNLLIIGNGPSAKTISEINDIKNLDLLCVNYFALENQAFFDLKPKFYCLIDPAFLNITEGRVHALIEIFEQVDWEMTLVIPQKWLLLVNNKKITRFSISSIYYSGKWFRTKLVSNNIVNIGHQNVINGAIQFAISAKYKVIYLIGVENDWHRELFVNRNNDVLRKTKHFYGESIANVTDSGTVIKGELFKYFYWYYNTLLIYHEIARVCNDLDIKVYNLVPESYIDVFDKNISLDKVK